MPLLPPELWLLIFDFAILSSLNPAAQCSYIKFPEISLHLRFPSVHAPIEDPYGQLRLVCRDFKALLGPSPHFFVKSEKSSIPSTARAIYIPSHRSPLRCLQRVLEDPYKSRRIVTLHITCTNFSEHILPFDYLCQRPHALSSVRSLTLGIFYHHPFRLNIRLWGRINKAFPLLVCLVLRPVLQPPEAMPIEGDDKESSVIFQRLEILDMGCIIPCPRLRCPLLRHAALNHSSPQALEILTHSPLLESLLLRGVDRDIRMDLRLLPQLRLLGLPTRGPHLTLPLPPNYPLYHLCVYMVPPIYAIQDILSWVKTVPTKFPSISRISIDLSMLTPTDRLSIQGLFVDPDLQSSGLIITSFPISSHLIVLERVPVVTQPMSATISGSPSNAVSCGQRFRRGWGSLCRFTIRTLHL
jgi:hypothetical protein